MKNDLTPPIRKRPLRALLILLSAVFLLSGTISAASLPGKNGAVPCLNGEMSSDTGFFGILPDKTKNESRMSRDFRDIRLIPGGMPFGIRMQTEGVLVTGTSEVAGTGKNPAYDAGIRALDLITRIGNKRITSVSDVTEAVEKSGGNPLEFSVTREQSELKFIVTPVLSPEDGKYRTGLWIKDGTSGIGTVTYIVPDTFAFGGLGHGVCDTSTGVLLPLTRGSVIEVTVTGAVRGVSGTPGELKGFLGAKKTGTLLSNTFCGVFGAFTGLPDGAGEAIPIAMENEVICGKAEILSTVCSETGIRRYGIEISEIRHGSEDKSFVVRVTDPDLISQTGGIVQGMSGSPILQNGKLVGAVTHVMVNDPTRGYGIFIGNMLSAMPEPLI